MISMYGLTGNRDEFASECLCGAKDIVQRVKKKFQIKEEMHGVEETLFRAHNIFTSYLWVLLMFMKF